MAANTPTNLTPIRDDRNAWLSPRRCLLGLTAALALTVASVAPAQRHDGVGTNTTNVNPAALDASTNLVDPDSQWTFAFDVNTAGNNNSQANNVDSGAALTPVALSNGNGTGQGFAVDLSQFADASQIAWTADVFTVNAGQGLASGSNNNANANGGGTSLVDQNGAVIAQSDFATTLGLLGSSSQHLGSFSGVIDLNNNGDPVQLLIVIGLIPNGEGGLAGGNGGNGSIDPAVVPTPAAIGPGLVMLTALLWWRRRQKAIA